MGSGTRSAKTRDDTFVPAGERREALDAFDSVRAAVVDDPLALAQLAYRLRLRQERMGKTSF